jgi:hypothetical protein
MTQPLEVEATADEPLQPAAPLSWTPRQAKTLTKASVLKFCVDDLGLCRRRRYASNSTDILREY